MFKNLAPSGMAGILLALFLSLTVAHAANNLPELSVDQAGESDHAKHVEHENCRLTDQESFQSYTVQTFFEPQTGVGHAAVWYGETLRIKLSGGRFGIGGAPGSSSTDHARVPLGEDITGDGTPNLLLIEYTGGAHCCYVAHIISLEEPLKTVAVIEALHTLPVLRDLRGDGRRSLVLRDWTFGYWRAPYVDSPAPRVVLTPQNNNYIVDLDLMWRPAPTAEERSKLAQSVRNSPRWHNYDPQVTWNFAHQPPTELWETMLDLIYTGHPSLAMEFFKDAWPTSTSGRSAFLADFRSTLESSPYWPTLAEWGLVE